MLKNFLIILALFATSACTGPKMTFVRSAPNYSESLDKSKIALILPPNVEVNQIDALNKKTRVHNYEDRLEEIIVDELIAQIQKKGYDHVKFFSKAEIAASKLSKSFVDIKDQFSDALKDLYKGGAWPEEKAYSINHKIPSAIEIAEKAQSDLLIVVDFYAESKTSAAITKDFTTDILKGVLFAISTGGRSTGSTKSDPSEVSILKLAIIDTLKGQILWTHSVSISNDMISTTIDNFSDANKVDKSKLSKLINGALEDLPNAK